MHEAWENVFVYRNLEICVGGRHALLHLRMFLDPTQKIVSAVAYYHMVLLYGCTNSLTM